jgi:hypothetical protein
MSNFSLTPIPWPPSAPPGIPAGSAVPVQLLMPISATNAPSGTSAKFRVWRKRRVLAPVPIPPPYPAGRAPLVIAPLYGSQEVAWPFPGEVAQLVAGQPYATTAENLFGLANQWLRGPWIWVERMSGRPEVVVVQGVFKVGGGVLVWNSDGTVSSATPLERRAAGVSS